MEKQINPNLSLLTLLPEGKVESDFRITDKTVTGICTVYAKRTDNENEFLLREIGVASLDGGNLTEAVQIAVSQARNAAISLIAGISPFTAQQPQLTVIKPTVENPIPAPEVKAEQPAPSPVNEDKGNGESEVTEQPTAIVPAVQSPPPLDLSSIVQPGASAPAVQANPTPASGGGIEKIEFDEIQFPNAGETPIAVVADEDADPEYQKALDMEITIVGKLHTCNGWKAGMILDRQPDVIVDFCQRNSQEYDGPKYTGPRTDQKEALFKLYPDAIRKTQNAA
jgi:hypothetical protein